MFTPTSTHHFPFGEGALERIFDHIFRFDPGMLHFAVRIFRADESVDRYASLNELPEPESEIRGPLMLPLPPSREKAQILSSPPYVATFSYPNSHEVVDVLQQLHHSLHGATNFYTYAVLIAFNPSFSPAERRVPGIPPPRLFPRSPLRPSCCLLAVSGHRVSCYSAADTQRYLRLCSDHLEAAISSKWEPVEVDAILPYLTFPRHTLDTGADYNLQLPDPDFDSRDRRESIWRNGFSLPSAPERNFDAAAYLGLQNVIYGEYIKWLNAGIDYKVSAAWLRVHRFPRNHTYLRNRFPKLRDWLIHATNGGFTIVPPTWDISETVGDELASAVLGDPQIEDDLPDDPFSASVPVYYPNFLYTCARLATAYIHQFFCAGVPIDSAQYERLREELDEVLVDRELLKALLTEIGEIDCREVEIAMRDRS